MLFHAQVAPARGVGLGTRRAGQGKSGAGFYHSHRPRKQRASASVKQPLAAFEDNNGSPPQASPSMQFRKKQVRDRKFADARATHLQHEVVLDNSLFLVLFKHACAFAFVVACHACQVAAAGDQQRMWLAAAQSGRVGSDDNIVGVKASSEHSHGSLHHFMREDEADAPVLALHEPLLCEGSSDETHKDNDSILEPTTPEADPVGEPAMPEGLLHKAGWTFVSTCH